MGLGGQLKQTEAKHQLMGNVQTNIGGGSHHLLGHAYKSHRQNSITVIKFPHARLDYESAIALPRGR